MRPEVAVIAETYVAIASTLPQVRIDHDERRVVAQGPFAHPICNFGLVLQPSGLTDVIAAGTGRPHYNLYTFESTGHFDVPDHSPGLAMRIMSSPARRESNEKMERADNPRIKAALARFMVDTFFSNQKLEVKERIAEATARAVGMEHFAWYESANHGTKEPVCAAMLALGASMAGIFNVVVRQDRRGQGLGRRVVEAMVAEAARRGLATTLQCDPGLESWYADQGFVSVDTMTVWSPAP